jgi:hypothetical protein
MSEKAHCAPHCYQGAIRRLRHASSASDGAEVRKQPHNSPCTDPQSVIYLTEPARMIGDCVPSVTRPTDIHRRRLMRKVLKYVRLAALAGAVMAAGVAVSHRADAMTFSTPAGVLAAAADEGSQAEQVRWCGWRGCFWRPRVYGYYAVRPYWGWGYRRWWW